MSFIQYSSGFPYHFKPTHVHVPISTSGLSLYVTPDSPFLYFLPFHRRDNLTWLFSLTDRTLPFVDGTKELKTVSVYHYSVYFLSYLLLLVEDPHPSFSSELNVYDSDFPHLFENRMGCKTSGDSTCSYIDYVYGRHSGACRMIIIPWDGG